MRDKQFRKQQAERKKYKDFVAENKRLTKFKDPQKGARSSNKLKQNDIDSMIEEELEDFED